MNELVTVTNLTKVYDKRKTALNQMNLSIPKGKIVGLLGPNGSGKTTLIKIMNGLLRPTEGTVLINGSAPGPETKARISYLPERTYLRNSMKVKELIAYFADFYEDFKTERAKEMLESLGIDENAKIKTLSKGTREKVQLILVMSRDADLFILDEPIAGVDPAARDYIIKTIITNYNENATVLLSTHLISDIENVLDEVIFIKDGNMVMQATVEEIREEKGKSVDAYFREVFAC
ncbi:MAG: ABC transporter ATP-binding protein [Lachnospiraceae bacterium]|nr:ABC transporter ATP-binding protein [Lachnospiraceae bacterium]